MRTSPKLSNPNAPYFNKGKRYYKLGFYVWLAAVLLTQLVKLLPDEGVFSNIRDLAVGIPIIAEYVIVPLAIINLVKSFRHREPANKYRTFYLIVLFFIALFLLLLLLAIWGDLRSILGK